MRFSLIKLFLLILFFAAVFPAQKAHAAPDNDIAGQDCTITFGGVESLQTSNTEPLTASSLSPTIWDMLLTEYLLPFVPNNSSNTSGSDDDYKNHNYDVKVCLPDPSVLSKTDPSKYSPNNEPIVAAFSLDTLDFPFYGYNGDQISLSPDPNDSDCLVGTLNSGANSFSIDIETANSRIPICRRQHGILSPMNATHLTSFFDSMANFCSENLTISPESITINDEVLVSINIPEPFRTNGWFGNFIAPNDHFYQLKYSIEDQSGNIIHREESLSDNGKTSFVKEYSFTTKAEYKLSIWLQKYGSSYVDPMCSRIIDVGTPDRPGGVSDGDTGDEEIEFNLCSQIPGTEGDFSNRSTSRGACRFCEEEDGIWTALGCIPTDGEGTINTFISIALGMSGGIGLLMIIASGAMFTMSQNDPTKVNSARDLLSSVIIGLLFIVFSVTILQFIGVTILQIPGFGAS